MTYERVCHYHAIIAVHCNWFKILPCHFRSSKLFSTIFMLLSNRLLCTSINIRQVAMLWDVGVLRTSFFKTCVCVLINNCIKLIEGYFSKLVENTIRVCCQA